MVDVNKRTIYCLMMCLVLLMTMSLVFAEDNFNNPTGSSSFGNSPNNFPGGETSFGDVCSTPAKADFDIFISSCTPSVVTSNLLAEQDVSVMCQLNAVRLNSLIQASAISSISFSGDYPEEVRSISYHPYRSSLSKSSSKIIDDVLENIGYVVVVLKKQPNEDNLEKYVTGILTANIKYTFVTNDRIKDEVLYLSLDERNTGEYLSSTGLVKVRDYSSESVQLVFNMLGLENYASFNLKEGQTSDVVYLPGYECKAGFRVKFEGIVPAKNKVDLNIDGMNYMLREGDSILNGACVVNRIVKDCDIAGSKDGVKCEDAPVGQVMIKCGSEIYTLRLKSRKNVEELVDKEKNIESFKLIKEDLTELLNNFPKEKSPDEKYYAEMALYDSIFLARDLGLEKTQKELVNRYLKEFQYSEHFSEISIMGQGMQNVDRSEGARNINLQNGLSSTIIINNFHFLSDEKSVTVSFNLNVDGEDNVFPNKREGEYIEEYGVIISRINEDSAVFWVKGESISLAVGESKYFENENKKIIGLRLDNVNYNNVAKVRIIPKIDSGDIAMNFTFHIPIEKRFFALTPEKAKKRADEMNDTIRIVGNIVDAIEVIHNGWNAVCGVARTYTTIKMITALANGEALYRMSVMQVFKEGCRDSPDGMDKCLLDNNDAINKAVKQYSKDVKDLKSKYKESYKMTQNERVSAGSLLNDASEERGWKSASGELFINVNGVTIPLEIDDMSVSQMEKYTLFSSVADFNGGCGDKDYYCKTILGDVNKEFAPLIEQQTQSQSGKILFSFTLFPLVRGDSKEVENNVNEKEEEKPSTSKKSRLDDACSNVITTGNIEYYEVGSMLGGLSNVNGLAAVVPFDRERGWYAYVSSSRGDVFDDRVKAYSSNGEVLNFYICNVGKDNTINYGLGQDLCRSFEVRNPIYDKFTPCESYTEAQVKDLYNKAYTAIMEANRQYGSDTANILGQTFTVGKTLFALMDFECMDFLSPQDCLGVQKVCDWVECPSDRCDLKGKWRVQDVTQTGVIGSIVYCIGNGFVCIPGIYAGLDAFRSMLVEHQNCLNTRATTGEYVGSCDKIRSFYICEMVTKHAVSLVNSGLNWVGNLGISKLSGGSTYLNFLAQRKELNAIASNYIANYLSTSLDKLFDINLENVSYDLCNAIINTPSIGIGDGGKQSWLSGVWNSLSPTTGAQFTGSVSEKSYTDATTPPESIYSVFYSIYAGSKDRSYSVYLTDPSSISYDNTYVIAKGIIPARESKIENKDFTAISGYRKLCISVDGDTKCDFGVTSSLYGVNRVIDKILLADVNSTKITTEADCLSFSHGLNLIVDFVEGDNMLDSRNSISSVGITRVCASRNPESGASIVESDERWRNVGYCGDENVICWLDTKDINKVLSTIDPSEIKDIGIKRTVGSYEQFDTKLEEVKKKINSFAPEESVGDVKTYNEINKDLEDIIGTSSGATNSQKAYAYYLKISLNSILAKRGIVVEDGIAEDCVLSCLESMGEDNKEYCHNHCEKLVETISVSGFSYNSIKGEILYETRSTGICIKEGTGVYDYYLQSCSIPYTKFGYINEDKSISIISGHESKRIKGEDITFSALSDYSFIGGEFKKNIGLNLKENKIYYNYNYIDMYLSADRKIYDLSGKNIIASLNSNDIIVVSPEFKNREIIGVGFTYEELEKYRISNGALYKDADRVKDSCAKNGWTWLEDEKRCVECMSSSECGIGRVCSVDGMCVNDFCSSDLECGKGYFCDLFSGKCMDDFIKKEQICKDNGLFWITKDRKCVECLESSDCGIGKICSVDKMCVNDFCSSDLECDKGYFCDLTSGKCFEEFKESELDCKRSGFVWGGNELGCVECISSLDCGAGVCVKNVCVSDFCSSDLDCNSGYFCNLTSGKCINEFVREEERCIENKMVWITESRTCVECLVSLDCSVGKVCDEDNRCVNTYCSSDLECESGYHCDLFSGKCMYDYNFYVEGKHIVYGGERTKFFIDDKGKVKKSGILFFNKNVGKVLEDGAIVIDEKQKGEYIGIHKLVVLENYTFRDGVLEKK